jgi:hypothetical protein
MKAMSKEVRWALSGFIGGFILCYFLTGAFHQPQQSARPTQLTQLLVPSPVPAPPMNIKLDKTTLKQQLTPADPTYRASMRPSPALRNVPLGTLPQTYSTELIDGRDQSLK